MADVHRQEEAVLTSTICANNQMFLNHINVYMYIYDLECCEPEVDGLKN